MTPTEKSTEIKTKYSTTEKWEEIKNMSATDLSIFCHKALITEETSKSAEHALMYNAQTEATLKFYERVKKQLGK